MRWVPFIVAAAMVSGVVAVDPLCPRDLAAALQPLLTRPELAHSNTGLLVEVKGAKISRRFICIICTPTRACVCGRQCERIRSSAGSGTHVHCAGRSQC